VLPLRRRSGAIPVVVEAWVDDGVLQWSTKPRPIVSFGSASSSLFGRTPKAPTVCIGACRNMTAGSGILGH
jgi:hypothetical protein